MKIHIVQKGDTLWKIAKKYGVNFEELKNVNAQLSNPDLIMPGMKIKVPSADVPVKYTGSGSSQPKEYVKEVQQKEFPAEPKLLSIQEEEEPQMKTDIVSEKPAEQQAPQKEVQMKPVQKEVQMKPVQKEVQAKPVEKEAKVTPAAKKEAAVKAVKAVVKAVHKKDEVKSVAKSEPAVQKEGKEGTKFSVNILPQPPELPTKDFTLAKELKVPAMTKKEDQSQVLPIHEKTNILPSSNENKIVADLTNQVSPISEKANESQIPASKSNVSSIPVQNVSAYESPKEGVLPIVDVTNPYVPSEVNKGSIPSEDAYAGTIPSPIWDQSINPSQPNVYQQNYMQPAIPTFTEAGQYTQPPLHGQPYNPYDMYPPQPNPSYYPQGQPFAPYDMVPPPYPSYYGPLPYPSYAPVMYPPAYPYPPAYATPQAMGQVQGAYSPYAAGPGYVQPEPYESSSLYMPTPTSNVAPASNQAPVAEEDCGCEEPPQPYPFAPQPGLYGTPYYPTYQQAPYVPSMPYAPYPQASYYRQDQQDLFGTPKIDDDDNET